MTPQPAILVTGASRGIGRAVVLALARAQPGAHMVGVARSAEALATLGPEVAALGGTFEGMSGDLATEPGLLRLVERLPVGLRLGYVLLNAGALVNKPFVETTPSDWQHTFAVNVLGQAELLRQLLLRERVAPGAHVLWVSSRAGISGPRKYPGLSAYSASKGAVSILTEQLAEELAPLGISVNALALGGVLTEMFAEAFPGAEAPAQPEAVGAYVADFLLTGHRHYNGKVLPLTRQTP